MRRRDLLRFAGVVPAATMTAWLAGCDALDPAAPVVEEAPRDLLVVRTEDGLALVDASLARIVAEPRAGVEAYNGFAFATSMVGARTTVGVTRSTGRPLYQSEVDGAWQARGGTTIVLADERGERKRFALPGCVEPEAFSAARDDLYVLDYLPPEAPDRYRVRALNLDTGSFQPLLTRDKQVVPLGAEEEMRGEGRQSVYVHQNEFLFTLYTHQPDHEHTRDLIAARPGALDGPAFVHSLSLSGGFAYCIDLPTPFGEGPPEGHVIAVAPNSTDPVVVDTTSGGVAELDGEGLAVRTVAAIPPTNQAGPASAVLNGLLFLGRGTTVRGVRPEGYGVVFEWPMASPVRGLGLSANRRRLWVGQEASVVAYDVESGQRLAAVQVPGLVDIEAVGASS